MTEQGPGEMMERRRRRIFIGTIGLLIAGGVVAGGVMGFHAAANGVPLGEFWTSLSPGVAIGAVAAFTIVFLYGTWRFFAVIDEVELLDNLWGSTLSYYLYATLFPVWWALAKAGVVAEPHDWAIYFIALVGGMLLYGVRKWRAR